jgi:hypothetical protein
MAAQAGTTTPPPVRGMDQHMHEWLVRADHGRHVRCTAHTHMQAVWRQITRHNHYRPLRLPSLGSASRMLSCPSYFCTDRVCCDLVYLFIYYIHYIIYSSSILVDSTPWRNVLKYRVWSLNRAQIATSKYIFLDISYICVMSPIIVPPLRTSSISHAWLHK